MNISNYADDLKINIGGKLYGGIVYYSIRREPNGDGTSTPNMQRYIITVKRICRAKKYETVDNFDQYTVDFTVERLGKKATFSNCTVNSVTEELYDENKILQTVNLTATSRTAE